MLVNSILDLARNNTGTTIAQIPNATAIVWANIVYRKMVRKIITEISENFFNSVTVVDATVSTTNYALPAGFIKLKAFRRKQTVNSPYFTQSTEVDFSKMEKTIDWYQLYQSSNSPIHQIIGDKIYIAPVYKTDEIGGVTDNNMIEMDCELRPAALAVDGAESAVLIPIDYHHVIATGMEEYINRFLRKTAEANSSIARFKMEVDEMLENIDERDDTKNILSRPLETSLE